MRKSHAVAKERDGITKRLDRLEVSDAGLLVFPGQILESASEWMTRARRRGVGRSDLEIRGREIKAAGALLDWASLYLGGFKEFVQARNALQAVLGDDIEVVEWYTQTLGLPRAFPEVEKRIRGEEWRFRDSVAEALHERRWIKPPGCTHIARYIRNRAWQILKDRKKADEQEHIDAGEHDIVIRNFSPEVASNLGYDALQGMGPSRTAIIDFRLDVDSGMEAVNADARFRTVMAALLFDEERWADLSKDKHFSTEFRRDYAGTLRHFREHVAAYLEPPERRTLEERIEADARNSPGYLRRLKRY